MFNAGSLLDSINVYLAENLAQSIVAALLVLPLLLWVVKSPSARIRFLLVPLALPVVFPPVYYLLVPSRQELPVIPLDRILGLKQGLSFLSQWPDFTAALALAFGLATAYFLARGMLAAAAVIYLPRRYPKVDQVHEIRIERMLDRLVARRRMTRPALLQGPWPNLTCCSFGFRRPYLLLSRGLLEELDDEHLEGVVVHEMAHFLRRDQYLNLALLALRSFFFFNPVVQLLCRAIQEEEELACDALAVRLGVLPRTYAESLVKVWWSGPGPATRWEPATTGFLNTRSAVRRRVAAVLDRGGTDGPGHNRLLLALTSCLLILLFFVC